jgi:hypothetical protein
MIKSSKDAKLQEEHPEKIKNSKQKRGKSMGTSNSKKRKLTLAVNLDIDTVAHKSWLINSFEEIGWLDPDTDDMIGYNGRQPMTNHPFDVTAYPEVRYIHN